LWNSCLLNTDTTYHLLSAIGDNSTGKIYVFDSDIMSGPLAYVCYVIFAQIYGVDTGYNATELVQEYNEKYGFSESSTGLAFAITITGGTASASQIV
jgi:hypothetical protein